MKDDAKEMETTSALELIEEVNERSDLEPEVDETFVPDGFVLTEQGLYKLVPLKDGSCDFQWICDWIHVKALTENIEGRENGILVELRTRKGTLRELIVLAKHFSGSGTRVIAELLDLGFRIAPGPARKDLLRALQEWNHYRWCISTTKRGWVNDRNFILPDSSVLGPGNFKFVGQDVAMGAPKNGTLEGWRTEVASKAPGNPLVILAIAASLAGPLLAQLGLEGGGVHYRGGSSSGKSTLLNTAASVWYAPGEVQSWQGTISGMEAKAAAFNGTCLCLDELAEVSATAADTLIYVLANGSGKARANSQGGQAEANRFGLVIQSSGEIDIATKLAEGGRTAQAGQTLRLMDLQADSRQHGVFDTLHDLPDGRRFSEHLKTSAAMHHGHAGPAFVDALLKRGTVPFIKAQGLIAHFLYTTRERHEESVNDIADRAMKRFAVYAAAGELATAYGLTGWPPRTAYDAAQDMFGLWLQGQATPEEIAEIKAVRRVQAFLERHGEDCRDLDLPPPDADTPLVFRKDQFAFLPRETWTMIHGSVDPRKAAHALETRGLLSFGDGRNMMAKAPTGSGMSRGYKVHLSILDWKPSEMSESRKMVSLLV